MFPFLNGFRYLILVQGRSQRKKIVGLRFLKLYNSPLMHLFWVKDLYAQDWKLNV